ncbi:MAG: hypothetical protein Kow0079_00390 [Vicingaceae bacterium]
MVFSSISIYATHIVGGSLTYEHIGGSTYRVTLKLYRDCSPSSVFFPGSVRIEVRQPNGASFSPDKDIIIPLTTTQILNPPIDTCAYNPGVCVEEAIYTKVVNNLPPNNGGYHLFYTFCCRNASLVNVQSPLSTGEGFYTFIPDNNIYLTNSSPQWKNVTPVFICQGQPLNFDHGATDKDGDSLVYSFYNPFNDNNPTFPGNVATFTPITYTAGYNANDPLGGSSLSVNPQTGVISGIPPNLGQYVVGVRCDEYRNGVLINTIYRDFQFNVLNCPPIPMPLIGPVDACSGNTVQFNNQSVPLTNNNFHWDFGDTSTNADTSNAVNPSYTYPGIGTYIVTLIAQYGTPCADTTYDTIYVSWVNADFNMIDSTCMNTPVTFNDASTSAPGSNVVSWYYDFGDGNNTSNQNPTHIYNNGNTYTVSLVATSDVGCSDTITKDIYIQDLPQVLISDTFACVSNPVINLNGNVTGATGGVWSGSGTFSPNTNDLNAAYTPTAGELSQGYAIVTLISTGNGFCPANTDSMQITYTTGVQAIAGNDIYVCRDSTNIPLSGTIIDATGGQWWTSGTGNFIPNTFDMNAVYNPSSADTAAGSVSIYLQTIGNSNCLADTDTVVIYFSPAPYVAITTGDTACAGAQLIPLNATSTTGSGVWTTLGGGTFSPSDSLPNTNYLADSTDNANGSVTLIFTSTNNGGCQKYRDTINLNLIPPPVADFTFGSECPRTPVTFTDNSSSISSITGYSWNFGNGNTSTSQNPTNTFDTSGTYNVSLIVYASNGCTDTSNQQVLIYAFPQANFNINGVCQAVESQFTDSSTVNGSTIIYWNWDFGNNGDTAMSQNPVYTYPNSGTYPVTLIVQSAQGCYDTITNNVTIGAPPTALFNSSPTSVKVFEDFNFTDQSFSNIVAWSWNFGDGSGTSTQQNPTYSYSESGNYLVCLTVTDFLGCEDSTCNEVIVFMPPAVPNAFTPNGDGQNDIFRVLGGPFKELEFKVYNNWGELIFESSDQSIGWDGTRDGVEQPLGVYVYTVQGITYDDVQHSIKGDVTLIR